MIERARLIFAVTASFIVVMAIVSFAWWANFMWDLSGGDLWGLGVALFPPIFMLVLAFRGTKP